MACTHLDHVLITQLQLWRVTWILDLLALASLPLLLEREWRKGLKGRCAAVAVFVAVLLVICGLTHRFIEAPMQRLGRQAGARDPGRQQSRHR